MERLTSLMIWLDWASKQHSSVIPKEVKFLCIRCLHQWKHSLSPSLPPPCLTLKNEIEIESQRIYLLLERPRELEARRVDSNPGGGCNSFHEKSGENLSLQGETPEDRGKINISFFSFCISCKKTQDVLILLESKLSLIIVLLYLIQIHKWKRWQLFILTVKFLNDRKNLRLLHCTNN